MIFIVLWCLHDRAEECEEVLRPPKISSCWSLYRTKCQQKSHFTSYHKNLSFLVFHFFPNHPINLCRFCFQVFNCCHLVSLLQLVSLCVDLCVPWSVRLKLLLHAGSAPVCRSSCWAYVPEIQPLPRWLSEVCQGSQAETVRVLQKLMPGFLQ